MYLFNDEYTDQVYTSSHVTECGEVAHLLNKQVYTKKETYVSKSLNLEL